MECKNCMVECCIVNDCFQIYNKHTSSLGLIGLLAMLEGLTGKWIIAFVLGKL